MPAELSFPQLARSLAYRQTRFKNVPAATPYFDMIDWTFPVHSKPPTHQSSITKYDIERVFTGTYGKEGINAPQGEALGRFLYWVSSLDFYQPKTELEAKKQSPLIHQTVQMHNKEVMKNGRVRTLIAPRTFQEINYQLAITRELNLHPAWKHKLEAKRRLIERLIDENGRRGLTNEIDIIVERLTKKAAQYNPEEPLSYLEEFLVWDTTNTFKKAAHELLTRDLLPSEPNLFMLPAAMRGLGYFSGGLINYYVPKEPTYIIYAGTPLNSNFTTNIIVP